MNRIEKVELAIKSMDPKKNPKLLAALKKILSKLQLEEITKNNK